MNAETLIALAEKCEALTGPNYAIEIEIFKALHPEYADYVQGRGGLVHPFDGSDVRVLSDVRPPPYTASIDAALMIVPMGWRGRIFIGDQTLSIPSIGGPHGAFFTPPGTWEPEKARSQLCWTISLAVVSAALRARAATMGDQ